MRFETLVDDIHDLRAIAKKHDMVRTAEILRLAIIEAALETDRPTGLSASELDATSLRLLSGGAGQSRNHRK